MKNFNEMFVGLAVVFIMALAAIGVKAETLISYDDGSTYTVGENEEVYVAPKNTKLFTLQTYSKGDVYFRKQAPWANRDYVAQPTDGLSAGSHEWCKAYEPWSEGYTFNMQTFERHCDTNGDDKYGCGDETFDASEDGDVCETATTASSEQKYGPGETDETGYSQWCADFDTSQGATFGYITWQSQCDKNNDDEYNICDYYEPTGSATFADIQYNKQCLSSDGS